MCVCVCVCVRARARVGVHELMSTLSAHTGTYGAVGDASDVVSVFQTFHLSPGGLTRAFSLFLHHLGNEVRQTRPDCGE